MNDHLGKFLQDILQNTQVSTRDMEAALALVDKIQLEATRVVTSALIMQKALFEIDMNPNTPSEIREISTRAIEQMGKIHGLRQN